MAENRSRRSDFSFYCAAHGRSKETNVRSKRGSSREGEGGIAHPLKFINNSVSLAFALQKLRKRIAKAKKTRCKSLAFENGFASGCVPTHEPVAMQREQRGERK